MIEIGIDNKYKTACIVIDGVCNGFYHYTTFQVMPRIQNKNWIHFFIDGNDIASVCVDSYNEV